MEQTEKPGSCPECGASWADGKICQDYFHQLLSWEWEDRARWEVHHLMVLGFHLQHPSLYSPETLAGGIGLLRDFVEKGLTPQQARRQVGSIAASDKRTWKIRGTPSSHGEYARPVLWTMRAADVVAAGADKYCDSVRTWAAAICADLNSQLPPVG